MKTSGVSFDVYDDGGQFLKELFPTPEKLPSMIKEAHFLNPEERDVLRDEAFALVMSNEGKVMRKFACVDAGNTAMSVMYFLHNMNLFPPEAIKVAAANLVDACEEFGIDSGNLLKVAAKTGMARQRDPMRQPLVGDEADWASRTNLVSIRGGSDSGRVIPTANQMKTAGVMVDVSGKEPEFQIKRASAEKHALGDKYPLDSYGDVTNAIDYFSSNYKEMAPADRHEYAVKTAARANELGIHVTEEMERYGSTTYAPDVDAHLANRKAHCDREFHDVYDALKEKKASIEPEEFAQLLTEADDVSGLKWYWDGPVADPFMSTFGGMSYKQKVADWRWEGNENVTASSLKAVASTDEFRNTFESFISEGLAQQPVEVFESLPDTHKQLIAGMISKE